MGGWGCFGKKKKGNKKEYKKVEKPDIQLKTQTEVVEKKNYPLFNSFEYLFVGEFLSNEKIIRQIYESTTFRGDETKFLIEALYLLSTSVGKFDQLMKLFLEIEYARGFSGKAKGSTVLRSNTLATKLCQYHFQHDQKSINFLKKMCGIPIKIVLEEKEILEIEKNRIYNSLVGDNKKNTKLLSELTPMNLNYQKVYRKVKTNASKLSKLLNIFADYLFTEESAKSIPPILGIICRYINDLSVKYEIDPIPKIGSVMILRFINPAIMFPLKYGVIKNEGNQRLNNRNLTLVAKAIQSLANRSNTTDISMKNIGSAIEKLQDASDTFLKECCISDEKINEAKQDEEKEFQKNMENKTFNMILFRDLSLFLYNFFLYKGISLDFSENFLQNASPSKYGKIIYCAIYQIKNPKKKNVKDMRANTFLYCDVDYETLEDQFNRLIELIFAKYLKIHYGNAMGTAGEDPIDYEEKKIDNLRVCVENDISIDFLFNRDEHCYYFTITKLPFCNQLISKFLKDLMSDFPEPSYSENIELIHDKIVTYNNGIKFNPKDIYKFVKMWIYVKNEDDEGEAQIPSIRSDSKDIVVDIEEDEKFYYEFLKNQKQFQKDSKLSEFKNIFTSKISSKGGTIDEW